MIRSIEVKWRRWVLGLCGLASGTALAIPPSVSLISGPLVEPTSAWNTYYSGSSVHTVGAVASTVRPPEIKALARALGAGRLNHADYADQVFDYVRQNIRPEFRFGLGKGARGAVIDQSGTPFDQAQLMVEILREGGVTAAYRLGTITLTASQFGAWTQLYHDLNENAHPQTFAVNAKSACALLSDGGIPSTINGQTSCDSVSGSLSSVTMMHVWVESVGKVYDPSFKRYTLKAGINVPLAMGCWNSGTQVATCGSAVTSGMGGTSGSLNGVPYIHTLNETAVKAQLNSFGVALMNAGRAIDPYAQVEDIVGGGAIDRTYDPSPETILPYPSAALSSSWTGDIPDAFRTTLRVQFLGLDQMFFADELYGKNLRVATLGPASTWSRSSQILVDGAQVGSTATFPASVSTVDTATLTIDHPYAADAAGSAALTGTLGDESQSLYAGEDYRNGDREYVYTGGGFTGSVNDAWPNIITIIWAVGSIGKSYAELISSRPSTPIASLAGFPVHRSQHPGSGAQYLVHAEIATRLLEGVTKVRINTHHVMGVVFGLYRQETVSAQMNVVSATSMASFAGAMEDRAAAFETYGLVTAAVEGSVLQQSEDGWESFSAVSLLKRHNDGSSSGNQRQYLQVTSGNWTAAASQLQTYGYDTVRRTNLKWYVDNGFSVIVPRNAAPADTSVTNGTMQWASSGVIAVTADKISYTVGERIKGSASIANLDPIVGVDKSVKLAEHSSTVRKAYLLDSATGTATITPPPDIDVGTGEFPYSLTFQRTHTSSNRDISYCNYWFGDMYATGKTCKASSPFKTLLAGGWKHNLQISAEWSNHGLEGLGITSGVRASTAIADIYTAFDLLKAPTMARRLAANFSAYHMITSFMKNAFVVSLSNGTQIFVQLPNGTFDAPIDAPAAKIVSNLTRSQPFMLGGARVMYDYGGTTVQYQSPSGEIINFTLSGGIKIVSGNAYVVKPVPEFTAAEWISPTGAMATFSYTDIQNDSSGNLNRVLTQVSNNLGRTLTFSTHTEGDDQYWISGVMDDSGRAVSFGVPDQYCITSGVDIPGESFSQIDCETALSVTGTDGSVTTYSYAADADSPDPAQVVEIRHPLRKWFAPSSSISPVLTLAFDELWHVKTSKDAHSNTTALYTASVADEDVRFAETVDATGAVTKSYADQNGDKLIEIDALGRLTRHYYDRGRRRYQTIAADGSWTNYFYDIRSNLTSEVRYPKPGSSLAAVAESTAYMESPSSLVCNNLATCNKPAARFDGNGNITSFAYLNNGQLQRITGPYVTAIGPPGVSGSAQIDLCYTTYPGTAGGISLLSGIIEKVSPTENRIRAYTYNTTNRLMVLSATADPTATLNPPETAGGNCGVSTKSGALNLSRTFSFDPVGNISSIDGPLTGSGDTIVYTFSKARRLTSIAAPLGVTTRYCFDIDGQLVATQGARVPVVTDPNAATLTTTGACGAPFDNAQWRGEVRAYNRVGDLVSITDAEGNTNRFAYDAVGRQRVVEDADGRQSATVYDAAGQPIAVWKGGANWLTGSGGAIAPSAQAPTVGTPWNPAGYAGSGPYRYVAYGYTSTGRLDDVRDANNNRTDYSYDGLDRLQFTLFPDPAGSGPCIAPASDSGLPTCVVNQTNRQTFEQYAYDSVGNRLSLRTRNGETIAFHYDQANRRDAKTPVGQGVVATYFNLLDEPIQISEAAAGSYAAHTTSYSYDAAGRRLTESNDGRQVSFLYDQAGKRIRTTMPDGYFVSYEFDVLGRMRLVRENSDTTNELAYFAYDTFSRPSLRCMGAGTLTSCQSGGGTSRTTYTYYDSDRVSEIGHEFNAASPLHFEYDYNRSGQLTRIRSPEFYSPQPASEGVVTYVPNALNQYGTIQSNVATYDDNGNMTSWIPIDGSGKQTFTYDSENRLVSVAVDGATTPTIFYDYDGLGRRASKLVNGVSTTYLSDGDEEIAEYGGTSIMHRYIMGPSVDDRIARISSGVTYFYHTNHQGSVIAIESGGGIPQQFSYDEFGNPGVGTVSPGEPFRYTGRRFDPETGLYYYRARYYSPTTGRFLQGDPIGYEDDLNLYAYVANDPVNKTDPSGECAIICGAVIGAAIDGGIEAGTQLWNDGKVSDWGAVGRASLRGAAIGAATGGIGNLIRAGGTTIRVGNALIRTGSAGSTRLAQAEVMKAARATLSGLAKGEGRVFAGSGSKATLREAENLAKRYGGEAGDYQGVSSKVIAEGSNGAKVEVHAYRNAETGRIYEPKIKVQGGNQ